MMNALKKAMRLLLMSFACFGQRVKSAGKCVKRKSKRVITVFAVASMVLPLMQVAATSDAGIDHATHSGCKALSMGTTYIMVDGVEQADNCLSDGYYYLTEDIPVTLYVNGTVSLCLNGYSVSGDSLDGGGIEFSSEDRHLTVDDCIGEGKISGSLYAIYTKFSDTTVTVNGGTVGSESCKYGIYNASVYINGGSIIGSEYGVYLLSSIKKIYLSGTPVISGSKADIYGGDVYAYNGASPEVPYSGATLTLADVYGDGYEHGDVMVHGVTEGNRDRFVLDNEGFTKFSLVHDSDAGELKLEGELMPLTWYAEDGTTVLTGADYPAQAHYHSWFSDFPAYETEEAFLLNWLARKVGDEEWADRRSDYGINGPMEFKAKVFRKYPFEGEGTEDSPYLIQNKEALVYLAQVTSIDPYEYNGAASYNSAAVYYRMTEDIDLSSVCGETIGNWTPIGAKGFYAQFDGDGHTVFNLYYNDNKSSVGLFSVLNATGSVRNLTVTGFVSAKSDYSGVVGKNNYGTVENCLDLTATVPYGYTTDENGWMTFRSYDDSGAVDIQATYDGTWIKTSYSSAEQYKIEKSGLDGAAIAVTPTIINGGAYIKVRYTVTNNSDIAITDGKLAVHSDTQIGDNDKAAIEVIRDGEGNAIGFRMVDNHTHCSSSGAQLSLYFAGTGGVTDADTHWFGFYSDRKENAFLNISDKTASMNKSYEKDENGNYIKLMNTDSGIAFSWQNIQLAAGESKEFSWVINVGFAADPPQWSGNAVNLTVTADAGQNNRKINVAAKVKDAAGITDKLYYSVNGGDGVMLGGVIADGATEKNITGIVNTSAWTDGTYHLDFWVFNSKGAVSEKVRRTITISDGNITGDITVLSPELSHDWDTAWSYDETNHWHDCKNENCTVLVNEEKNGFAAHDFDNACDTSCNTCGYTRTITHIFNQKVMSEQYLVSAGTCTKKAKYYYSCACGAAGTATFFGDTTAHEYAYSGDGAVITEICAGGCGHLASASLAAPESRPYDGTAREATVSYSDGWNGGVLTVRYDSSNVNVGVVTASISKDGAIATLQYVIPAVDADIIPPVAKDNLVYDGDTWALVSAGSTTGGTMQYALGDSSVTAPASGWSTAIPTGKDAGLYYVWYKVVGGQNYNDTDPVCVTVNVAKAEITVAADSKTKIYGGSDPAFTWRVTEGTVKPTDALTGIGTSRASGEAVGDYTISVSQTEGSNPNYDITFVNGTLTVAKADQAAPTGIGKTDETVSRKADGTITGVTEAMEYRKDGEDTYTGINHHTIENLAVGTYHVRVKGDGNHNPSDETTVTVAAGRKLKIVVPAQQIGYSLTCTVYEVDWLDSAALTFTVAEGYSKTENFAISLNGNSDEDWTSGALYLSGINTDVNITVDGVADITAPTAEIKVKDNKWNAFLNQIIFGLFFKETQDVTITAEDNGSGVDEIQYYVSEGALKLDELSRITEWADYDGAFALNPNNYYVVYVKVTDKAGNTLYISSDGLVFDSIAPVFYGIEDGGIYYGDKTLKVFDEQRGPTVFTVDDIDVTDKINSNDEYTIAADNKEHTLIVTDKAGNVTKYQITVYKNYTEIPAAEKPTSPQTGAAPHLWLWIVLLFISSGVIILTVYRKKDASGI